MQRSCDRAIHFGEAIFLNYLNLDFEGLCVIPISVYSLLISSIMANDSTDVVGESPSIAIHRCHLVDDV